MSTVIKLGDKVKDKYTGMVGWVHGIASYLTGCNQVLVNPRALKDGVPLEGSWFDDVRIELVKEEPVVRRRDTGGPSTSEAAGLRSA